MSDLEKEYKVKVIERHTDIVTVKATNPEDACERAVALAECQFECVEDCEVID